MPTFDPGLLPARAALLDYLRRRLPDADEAEDVLHEALLKALRAAPQLHDDDHLVPWFYTVLNNAVRDRHRREGTAQRALAAYAAEADAALPEEDAAVLCACLGALVPALEPGQRAVIEADLAEEPAEQTAERLGLTRNALKVRRHRARRALRDRLEATCRTCAAHGCLDCSCRASA
ncbi:MAG TPA: sigma-70 family RNA polymerase sigma factor [Rubricoccaceae bacterium]|nr:sigma-70 family RNA polymerase sigma factor [Rubricoccaceae bacterium]